MSLIFYIFIFLLGLAVGSFLNSVIYRLALPNFSFWKNLGGRERSRCPSCKHNLSWKDLIPILSFFTLRGKCRYCKKKISWQYPLVEIITGALFVLTFWSSGIGIWDLVRLCFMFYVLCSMIVIFVYDLKHYMIPDYILFPVIIITFSYRFFENLVIDNWNLIGIWKLGFGNFILSALLASGFFLFIFLVSGGRWMGFGDVKLAFFMGLFLGLPDVLIALFLAFFMGAIIGLGLVILGDKDLKSEIPFGPFLITGTFLAFLWGDFLISSYLNFLKL